MIGSNNTAVTTGNASETTMMQLFLSPSQVHSTCVVLAGVSFEVVTTGNCTFRLYAGPSGAPTLRKTIIMGNTGTTDGSVKITPGTAMNYADTTSDFTANVEYKITAQVSGVGLGTASVYSMMTMGDSQ